MRGRNIVHGFLSSDSLFFVCLFVLSIFSKNTQNRNTVTLLRHLFLRILFMFLFFKLPPFPTEDGPLLVECTEEMVGQGHLAFSVCATEILRAAILSYGLNNFLQSH